MFRNRSTNKKEAQERVIIGEEIIDISVLRAEAKRAGTRFWVMLVLVSLISSLVVPYMSMASIAASNTKVFSGEVIPGYSMGGIAVSAYGVDINSWGQSGKQNESNPVIAKSQYGYWTKKRAENASANLVASQRADRNDGGAALYDYTVDDEYLSPEKKARGWIGITRDKGKGNGLSDFSSTGSGQSIAGRTHYSENVAPYRTQADWTFWDSQSVGGSTPSITATIYPDFVVLGWDATNKTARVLTNPDDIQNATNSKSGVSGAIAGTAAVPHYVPLSTLFDAFGIGDTVMNKDSSKGMNDLDTLFDAIMDEARKNDGKSPTLNKIVENTGNDPKNDLLIGTRYENLNGSNKASETYSDAWNPYPYSMVFKGASGNSTVVSSIYNNTEAYVYFSPQSAYNNYMNLRSEYDDLVNASAKQVADAEPQAAFQLGYYLAGMAILEAYLNEALPQDMTRGYVGPAEGNPLASATQSLMNAAKLDTRSGAKGTVSNLFSQSLGSVENMVAADGTRNSSVIGFRAVAYSQLMYDFADAAIVKFGAKGEGTWLGATSALMNTLSTYGYGVRDTGQNTNTAKISAGQGPNRGMTRQQNMARVTAFGPYAKSAESLKVSISGSDGKDDPLLHPGIENVANTGMYVPVYYPIQQHEMSRDEMQYRFQVLSLIPYNTLAYEIGQHGFNSKIAMSYQNNAIASLDPTKDYYSKVASLSRQLDDLNKGSSDSLGSYDKSKSIVINPQTNATTMVGDQKTSDYARLKDTTERVDNALMSFQSGLMNADNVHDLVDVIRAVPGVKYETFVRYYNPIKSSGGADDIFLTRITPAQTTYMPAILTSGYESAGGSTNNESIKSTMNADFDYFSIPSFAPCFAAKTAEDTYYGVLNYELRPFYTAGFLSTLPADSNIPDLESYEQAQEDIEEKTTTAMQGMKTKILTIYVLAKRLSFATAYSKLMDASKGADGFVTVGGLYYGDKSQESISSGTSGVSDKDVQAALKPTDPGSYSVPENDNGNQSFGEAKVAGEPEGSVTVVGGADNKIATETLSDGTEYGVSSDGSQVVVGGDTITVASEEGSGAAVQSRISSAQAQYQADHTPVVSSYDGGGGYGYYTYTDPATGQPVTRFDGPAFSDTYQKPKTTPTGGSRPRGFNDPDNPFRNLNSRFTSGGGGGTAASYSITVQTASGTHGSVTVGSKTFYRIALTFMSAFITFVTNLLSPTVAQAAPSSDAEKVYTDDKLEAKGYAKASASDWAEMKKSMASSEGLTFHIPSDTKLPKSGDFEYVMQEFGQKHILSDDVLNKKNIWVKTSNGSAFVTDLKTVFAGLYNDAYTHFLTAGEGDSYYWDTPSEIAKYDVNIDEGQSMRKEEGTKYNTVAMIYSDAANVDKARKKLDEYCDKAFEEINAIIKDLKMLNDNLPKQMQNVLAWADTQSSSESETNYETAPDDRTIEIKLGVTEKNDQKAPTIHNLYEAQRNGFAVYDNDGDYMLAESTSSQSVSTYDDELQARVVRGVAGTTALPSERLAAYTISATVARIDRLAPSSASSSSIPYSGIYTGNLNAGTDRYALIQAHTIDRQAISSGLSGDLRSQGSGTAAVSLANAASDSQTQQYIQSESVFVKELNASIIPNSVGIMEDAMSQTMPSSSTMTEGIESAHAGTRGGISELLSSVDDSQRAMAKASTFDNATMNRQSSVSQRYNASSRRNVYQSGGVTMASASAVTTDRQFAESLVDGTFSDTYAVIQSIALMMVLAFLMVIAFQNFIGYSSGREDDYISAQTKLKTVLPRALIAVAMIGLPPMGGTVGFQGGCFLLLQIINAMMDAIVGSFAGGTDMFNQLMSNLTSAFLTDFSVWDLLTKFFDIVIDLLAAAIFLVGSIFVVLLCLATDVILFLFWMIGPIVWAFYVWPYSASDRTKKGTAGLLGKATGFMGLKSFTAGEVGRDAPTGWVMGYISTLSTVVMWNIMFWVFSLVLTMMREGTSLTDAMTSLAKADPAISGYDPGSAGDVITGGAAQAIPDTPVGHLLLALLFIVVVYVMFRVLKNNMGGAMRMMYGTVGFAAKALSSVAIGHVAAAAKSVDVASKANKAMEAAGKADSMLGKAVNVGAKGIDAAAHGIGSVDNIINSPAAEDVGNRVNKIIDNMSKDVSDRADSSGAFDDLVGTKTVVDEDGHEKQVLSFTPALAGTADFAKRQLTGFKDFRLQHAKNKIANRLTQVANQDNDYRCMRQATDVNKRIAEMPPKDDGSACTFDDFANDVQRRISAASQGSISDAERARLREDAALIGIQEGQLDRLTSSPISSQQVAGQIGKAVANAKETYGRGNAIANDSKRRAETERRHEQAMAVRDSIEARAMSLDRSFGKQIANQNRATFDGGPLTKRQQKARQAKSFAKGLARQAGNAVTAPAKAANAMGTGGRLGESSPNSDNRSKSKKSKKPETISLSQAEHDYFEQRNESKKAEIKELNKVAELTVSTTKSMGHQDQSASFGEMAADQKSESFAALDKLNERQDM